MESLQNRILASIQRGSEWLVAWGLGIVLGGVAGWMARSVLGWDGWVVGLFAFSVSLVAVLVLALLHGWRSEPDTRNLQRFGDDEFPLLVSPGGWRSGGLHGDHVEWDVRIVNVSDKPAALRFCVAVLRPDGTYRPVLRPTVHNGLEINVDPHRQTVGVLRFSHSVYDGHHEDIHYVAATIFVLLVYELNTGKMKMFPVDQAARLPPDAIKGIRSFCDKVG